MTTVHSPHLHGAMQRMRRRLAGCAVAVLGMAAASAAYERIAQVQAQHRFAAPGVMVDVGGRRIQLDCRGSGSPTVVFESGLDMAGSLDWTAVQPDVARHTRACAYSRAGLMWSDPPAARQTAGDVARTLHAALWRAGESGPFVLVGHSMGGPYAMTFTRLFGAEVAALVLVDAAHPDQNRRFASLIEEPIPWSLRVGAALRHFGFARALAQRLVPEVDGRSAWQTDAVRSFVPRSIGTLLQECESIDETLAQGGALRDLGDRPLVVLTALRPYTAGELKDMRIGPGRSAEVQALWVALQADEARWSRRGTQRLVPSAGHDIQFDAPREVVDATLDVVDQVRGDPRPVEPVHPASP